MTEMTRVSRMLTTSDVSDLLGRDKWPPRRVRRLFEREGIGTKSGRYWYVTTIEIQAAFSSLAVTLQVAAAEGE